MVRKSNLTKEARDLSKRKGEEKSEAEEGKKNEGYESEEGESFMTTCQILYNSKDIPKLPMCTSKTRDSQKHLLCALFDTGMST